MSVKSNGFPAAMRGCLLTMFLFAASAAGRSQPQLDEYVAQALQSNLVLKEKSVSLDKALLAIREANTLFGPTVNFETQYTLARGGRTINIPIGDLLNPVYSTLNQLTGSNKFPQISNVQEQFLPNNFYDVRVRTAMPIMNPEVRINRDVKTRQAELTQSEIDTYRRELVKEVKSAYYDHLVTVQAIGIWTSALTLVEEGLRYNRSLLSNGKGLPAQVARAEAEVASVQVKLATAHSVRQNTAARLNFLMNRPLTDSVTAVDPDLPSDFLQILSDTSAATIRGREELKSLGIATEINRDLLRLSESYRKPRLSTFIDLAAQGFNFNVDSRSFFYLGGLSLQMPLYTGGRNRLKVRQAELDVETMKVRSRYVTSQLELSAMVSRNTARDAYQAWQASQHEERASIHYHKLVDKGYREGVNGYIELLEARNQLTSSRIQTTITKATLLKALAAYERETASYRLPPSKP
jgi:outer membrane protein